MNATKLSEEQDIVLYVYYSIRILQAILATFGNGITIVVMMKYRNLFATTNVFILCLTCSDFIAGALVCPMSFGAYLKNDGSYEWFEICRVKEAANLFEQGVTLGSTFLIAVDRYIYIVHPFRYQTLLTSSRVITMAASNVATSFILSVGTIYAFTDSIPVVCSYKLMVPNWIAYSVIYVLYPINILLIICLYYCIARLTLYTGRKTSEQVTTTSSASPMRGHSRPRSRSRALSVGNTIEQSNASVCNQLKVTRIVLVVLGYYLAVFLPTLILDPFVPREPPLGWFIVRYILFTLVYSTTWINPVIYVWKNGQFRDAVREMICYEPDEPDASFCEMSSTTDTTDTTDYTSECALPVGTRAVPVQNW